MQRIARYQSRVMSTPYVIYRQEPHIKCKRSPCSTIGNRSPTLVTILPQVRSHTIYSPPLLDIIQFAATRGRADGSSCLANNRHYKRPNDLSSYSFVTNLFVLIRHHVLLVAKTPVYICSFKFLGPTSTNNIYRQHNYTMENNQLTIANSGYHLPKAPFTVHPQ